jgi:antitoxin (DNA-binding transcriptional repressor) of toxin-antitoxin stability system
MPMYHDNVSHMRTATIRALKHDTAEVLGWVADGQTVQVTRRKQPVALLSPIKRKGKTARPDFAARLRRIYGNKILPTTATDLISESRGDS